MTDMALLLLRMARCGVGEQIHADSWESISVELTHPLLFQIHEIMQVTAGDRFSAALDISGIFGVLVRIMMANLV